MAAAGVVATLLPATAFSLREPYARGRFMIDAGRAIALATDFNPGSCFSESIRWWRLAARLHGSSPEESTALTINRRGRPGAGAGRRQPRSSKQGDVLILESPSYRFIPYHIGVSTVEKVDSGPRLDKSRQGECPC
jgi:imidazolonepropionase